MLDYTDGPLKPWLLSGELGDFLSAHETEELAEKAAWKYSEGDGMSKEQTIAYLEDNTSVNHISDVYAWASERHNLAGRFAGLDGTEEYALANYKTHRSTTLC